MGFFEGFFEGFLEGFFVGHFFHFLEHPVDSNKIPVNPFLYYYPVALRQQHLCI